MNVYTLDPVTKNGRDLIENYKSLIWNEKYADVGNFELIIAPNHPLALDLVPGTMLASTESQRLVIIRKVERTTDPDGATLLKITGQTMESLLGDRVIFQGFEPEPLTYSGPLGDIIKRLAARALGSNAYDAADRIKNIRVLDNTTDNESMTVEVKTGSFLETLKSLCAIKRFGFIFRPNSDDGYTFTIEQMTVRRNIKFSTLDGTLRSPRYVIDESDYKNVAYVTSKDHSALWIVSRKVSLNVSGFDRRVLYVEASDVDPANYSSTSELRKVLHARGQSALSEHQRIIYVDGDISEDDRYTYFDDYYLGDLVEFTGFMNTTNDAQIVEYTWVSDERGIRSYPTYQILED